MKTAVIGFVGLFFSGLFWGCGESSDRSNEGEHSPEIRTEAQQLSGDAARLRVVQEASYAMTGDWNRYTKDNWPDVDTLATFAYTSSDLGAWNALLRASRYSTSRYPGFYVSCMRTRSEGYLPYPYTKCSFDRQYGFGSFEMPYYACQGNCPAGKMRGGQCKPFMNLVAYRSGQYQGPNYSFKAFPSDDDMKQWSVSSEEMPFATYQNINEGDFLRLPYGHALIVVRKIPATKKVVVFDSNWIGGDGNEVVGSHVLVSSGSGNSNLGNYRVLKCVYKTNGRC